MPGTRRTGTGAIPLLVNCAQVSGSSHHGWKRRDQPTPPRGRRVDSGRNDVGHRNCVVLTEKLHLNRRGGGKMANQNCWEFKKCGREPGGAEIYRTGHMPAATDKRLSNVHGGVKGTSLLGAHRNILRGLSAGDVCLEAEELHGVRILKLVETQEREELRGPRLYSRSCIEARRGARWKRPGETRRNHMRKTNCWEYKNCGRGPGGNPDHPLGPCPAATEKRAHGVNGGRNGGTEAAGRSRDRSASGAYAGRTP